ncbi:MAG TPA: hypothetical protein VFR47_28680 [Anaerolineales bacterium]|nr:hypothetical protein [Anaerolineales bacterium]
MSSISTNSLPLLPSVRAEDVARFHRHEASIFHDPSAGSLTFTFHHTAAEPEVRIPVAQLGWPTDWSAFKAMHFTFHSTNLETISICFSSGEQTKAFRIEPLAGIRIKGVIPFDVFFLPTSTVTPRTSGYKIYAENDVFAFDQVEEIVFKMRCPSPPTQLTLYEFTLVGEIPPDDIIDKRPLIDVYGQWIPENWEDKAHNDEQLRQLWDREADRLTPVQYPFCSLGGDVSRTLPSTGFFRTAQVDGKWVFVDPHGHPFYSVGMDLVGYDQGSFATDVSECEYLFEQLPPSGPAWLLPGEGAAAHGHPVVSFYVANIIRRFGEGWAEKWTQHILARLRGWGFNTIANWSNKGLAISSQMPYVLPLDGWGMGDIGKQFSFHGDFPDVFSEEFAANVDAKAQTDCAPLKDDPNLIGWFIDNEPGWARPFVDHPGFAEMVLADSKSSATKAKLQELLRARPAEAQQIKADFLYLAGKQYFETITQAVRRHDPNHLVLGVRFAGRPDRRWVEMSRIFDVFSINIYSDTFAPDPDLIREYAEVSGRPVLIGEFTAATPGRGLQGLFYNVHKVRDHRERATAYRYYVENAASSPYIIGSHWFQMVDNLPTGRPSDKERLNYGFINVIDLPYSDLVQAAQETHRRLYAVKFGEVEPMQEVPRYI